MNEIRILVADSTSKWLVCPSRFIERRAPLASLPARGACRKGPDKQLRTHGICSHRIGELAYGVLLPRVALLASLLCLPACVTTYPPGRLTVAPSDAAVGGSASLVVQTGERSALLPTTQPPAPEPRQLDRSSGEEQWEDEGWEDEDWDEEEAEDTGRSFLYKELVISGFYSVDGVRMLPPDDPNEDHWDFSPRPPGSYIGFDYVQTFTPSSPINKHLPDGFQLSAIDLHPRFVFDRMETDNGVQQVDFAPQDFWARFQLAGDDRLTLRIGQFVLPYGVNPPRAPRQRFILPVEAVDLGLKWDWGVGLKGPFGEYDWEIAATIGSGEALHSTHLFRGSRRTSYLLTGRIGAPTYWDFQYGLSFLVGDLPTIRATNVMNENAVSRWRVGLDTFYKYGTYLMAGAQLTYGQDGFAGDEEYVMLTGGETADVLAYRVWADWVVPMHNDLRLGAQYESVIRDLSTTDSDDTTVILEAGYSLTTEITLMLDYRVELDDSMGEEDDAVYLTFVYYGL